MSTTHDADRLRSLPGLPGEARVTMLSPELLQRLQEQQQQFEADDEEPPVAPEVDDAEFDEQMMQVQ